MTQQFKNHLSHEFLENREIYLKGGKGWTRSEVKNTMMTSELDELQSICDDLGITYSPINKKGDLKNKITDFATNSSTEILSITTSLTERQLEELMIDNNIPITEENKKQIKKIVNKQKKELEEQMKIQMENNIKQSINKFN